MRMYISIGEENRGGEARKIPAISLQQYEVAAKLTLISLVNSPNRSVLCWLCELQVSKHIGILEGACENAQVIITFIMS